jgi:hypothetical protein
MVKRRRWNNIAMSKLETIPSHNANITGYHKYEENKMIDIPKTEHPILFSGEMVRAILDGRKTQTRRVINYPLNLWHDKKLLGDWALSGNNEFVDGILFFDYQTDVDDSGSGKIKCPYGNVGDHLWVRETFLLEEIAELPEVEDRTDYLKKHFPEMKVKMDNSGNMFEIHYKADKENPQYWFRWKPSIHMPRWASRIYLEIIEIRVERVQDISLEDCKKEGMPSDLNDMGLRYLFGQLWNKINESRGFDWDVNPFVWVVSFKRLE